MRRAIEISTVTQGHEAATTLYRDYIKPQVQEGARGRLVWEPIDTAYRHQLRKLFHGPVLNDFSWQVRVRDQDTNQLIRYAPPVWKQHLTNVFCPARFDAAGSELPKSTEALNDAQFAEFVMACEAYGATDLGIQFTEQDVTEK